MGAHRRRVRPRNVQPIQYRVHRMVSEPGGCSQAGAFTQFRYGIDDGHARTPKRFKRRPFIKTPGMPTRPAVIAPVMVAKDLHVARAHFLEIRALGMVTPLLFEWHSVLPPWRKHTPIPTFRQEAGATGASRLRYTLVSFTA